MKLKDLFISKSTRELVRETEDLIKRSEQLIAQVEKDLNKNFVVLKEEEEES